MIIPSASTLLSDNMPKTCWSRIRRFHNVAFVKRMLCDLHTIPVKQERNVQKQAEQIRYCLVQAKEYYDAAQSVSLATKPVLMYYSVMSLALAEILFKQDGGSSLDKARGQNAHHGLSFHIDPPNSSGDDSLQNVGFCLRAAPLVKEDDRRFGTFELWHRSSRETPILGQRTAIAPTGTTTTNHVLIMGAIDKSFPKLPVHGITLIECLQYMPSMHEFILANNIVSNIVRASVKLNINEVQKTQTCVVIIHPYIQTVLDSFYELIKIHPNNMYDVNINELPNGMILNFTSSPTAQVRIILPTSVTWTKDEVRFSSSDHPLNEFGLFYVALYIAGNYARYYPDKWLADVDSAAPVALAIEELLAQADQRVPLLALSELSRNYFVDG